MRPYAIIFQMTEPPVHTQDDVLEVVPEAVLPPPRHVQIRMPTRHNSILREVVERVNADEELYALWTAINVNAMDRLGMSDHGPVHVQIVANIALKLIRLLEARQITANIVSDYKMGQEDAEVDGIGEETAIVLKIPVVDDESFPDGPEAVHQHKQVRKQQK